MRLALVFVAALSAGPAAADYLRIDDREAFLEAVSGKTLRLGMFDVSLWVSPDGQIAGEAMGWPVTGTWEWRDGYFCRVMDWSGYAIDPNCQLVEKNGSATLRFTSDEGNGRSANFRLR